MKIAVIGSGIIGYMASSYLSRKGHEVICIAPELKKVRGIVPSIGKNNLKYDKPVSPKFQRNDFKENKITSDYLFKKTSKNFIGIELINDIGLARYWGANLALGGLSDDLQGLRLDKKEIEFIEEKIPVWL